MKLIGKYELAARKESFNFVGHSSLFKRFSQLLHDNRGKELLIKNMYKLRCAVALCGKYDRIGSELSLGLPWRGKYCR